MGIVTLANGSRKTTAEWLADRQSSLGSSEAAAALGVSPYDDDTPLRLYLRKIGAIPPVEENEAMRWGTRLEPLIAEDYAERTGATFRHEQLFLRHPDHDWMTATIDRVRDDGRIVELKTIGARGAGMLGIEGTDEVPHPWVVQVHHQLIIHGSDIADIAALVGGQKLRLYTVRRDERLARLIVQREAEFWDRVVRREPPDPMPGRDGNLMAVLYPEPSGEIEATAAIQAMADTWEDLGREIREKTGEHERIRDELLGCLRDNESAVLADGRSLKRYVVDRPEKTIVQKATTYPQLRIVKGTSR